MARINTNKTTDLLAFVKSVSPERSTKSGNVVADVELLDDSKVDGGQIVSVKVGVFGAEKLTMLKAHVGQPMVFFNLSVSCGSSGTSITHYASEQVTPAPDCSKTSMLTGKVDGLSSADDAKSLTANFRPTASKDVSGPQTLSCVAFLDYTQVNRRPPCQRSCRSCGRTSKSLSQTTL